MPFEVVLLAPAVVFIDSLELRFRAKALRTIGLLQRFGPQLPLPHARKLSGYDLWELRVQMANLICRLFYFRDRRGVFVITSGFIKKTTRTSRTEIDRAVNLKDEYNRGESL